MITVVLCDGVDGVDGVDGPPVGGTAAQISAAKDAYDEQLRLFREVEGIENAIRQQIVAAVEPKYISSLRNRSTNSIGASIPDIIEHLYDNYGQITPQ